MYSVVVAQNLYVAYNANRMSSDAHLYHETWPVVINVFIQQIYLKTCVRKHMILWLMPLNSRTKTNRSSRPDYLGQQDGFVMYFQPWKRSRTTFVAWRHPSAKRSRKNYEIWFLVCVLNPLILGVLQLQKHTPSERSWDTHSRNNRQILGQAWSGYLMLDETCMHHLLGLLYLKNKIRHLACIPVHHDSGFQAMRIIFFKISTYRRWSTQATTTARPVRSPVASKSEQQVPSVSETQLRQVMLVFSKNY